MYRQWSVSIRYLLVSYIHTDVGMGASFRPGWLLGFFFSSSLHRLSHLPIFPWKIKVRSATVRPGDTAWGFVDELRWEM